MALIKSDLSCVAQTAAGKVFTYVSTGDDLATVRAAGYFGGYVADGVIRNGDLVWVKASDGNALAQFASATSPTGIVLAAVDVDITV